MERRAGSNPVRGAHVRKVIIYSGVAIAIAACSGAGYAGARLGQPSGPPPVCVQHGPKGSTSATGNVMLWNFDRNPCPSGTYGSQLTAGPAGPQGPAGPKGAAGTSVSFYDKSLPQVVQSNDLNINVGCTAGDTAIGGGVVAPNGQLVVEASGPSSTPGAWMVDVKAATTGVSATFYAVCAHVG